MSATALPDFLSTSTNIFTWNYFNKVPEDFQSTSINKIQGEDLKKMALLKYQGIFTKENKIVTTSAFQDTRQILRKRIKKIFEENFICITSDIEKVIDSDLLDIDDLSKIQKFLEYFVKENQIYKNSVEVEIFEEDGFPELCFVVKSKEKKHEETKEFINRLYSKLNELDTENTLWFIGITAFYGF